MLRKFGDVKDYIILFPYKTAARRRRWRTPYGGVPYVPPTNTPLLTPLRTPSPIPSLCHTPYVCPPHTPSKGGGQLLSLFLYQIFDFVKKGSPFPNASTADILARGPDSLFLYQIFAATTITATTVTHQPPTPWLMNKKTIFLRGRGMF